MKMKVIKEKCIGCGACVGASPEVFEFDDDGLAKVKVDEIEEDDRDESTTALENCPTDAIIRVEDK